MSIGDVRNRSKPSSEDLEILASIRAGRRDDYAHLVHKYQERILRLCRSLLSNATIAEDAAQEVFLKAYQALDTFRAEAAFSTWLYRIATNHCRDLLRKRSRENTESWDALVEAHGESLPQLLTGSDDPKPVTGNAELIEHILSRLSPDHRLILTLREVQGLSYQELADTLAGSVDAIKARLRRARQALQETLRHFSGPENV